ncbi:polyphenol oxidase family protein [Veillonella sp. AS16]|uniref:polyphenol oxidase family protein n=1 Tax=Veillonella sp. AS16 TaxID=936589 RepID=UPI0003E28A59|nr:polyphenol oxidase family protein [Veillonella sp. AS16]ETS91733.1 YfiH family protein [Veillonella sp. AS16]
MKNDVERIDVEGPYGKWSYEQPLWANHFPVVMGDTYRHGGVSEKPYDSLNLAFHVGDDPESVRRNRSVITDYLGVDAGRITCGNQVHGLKVVEITEQHIGAGAFNSETAVDDCDAIFTKIPNVPLLLFTADCVGVGIYDAAHHALAVVHAGWRGAIDHLPVRTIETMHAVYGTKFEDCYVYLGPSIGPESFEVDCGLAKRFEQSWLVMTNREVTDLVRYRNSSSLDGIPSDCSESFDSSDNAMNCRESGSDMNDRDATSADVHRDKGYVNLWAFIEEGLIVHGVPKEHICIGGTDSMIAADCYSYRRENGITGRMALFGMLRAR